MKTLPGGAALLKQATVIIIFQVLLFLLAKFLELVSRDRERENPFLCKIINRDEFGFHEPIVI